MAPHTDYEAAFAQQVRVELADRSMQQAELAERMDMDAAQLSRYLRGHRGIKLPMAVQIADALEMPLSDLLRKVEARSRR